MRQRRRLCEDTIHSDSDAETLIDRARRLSTHNQLADLGQGPKLCNVESQSLGTPPKIRHAHRAPSEPSKSKGIISSSHGEGRSRHSIRRRAASQPHASVEELRRRSLARAREACGEGTTQGERPGSPKKEMHACGAFLLLNKLSLYVYSGVS